MVRDGTRHSLSRFLVGLLAAWMVVTAVLSTVHNHQLPGPASSVLALDREEVAGSQTGTCFACLAAHVPLPAPMAPAVLAVPNDRPVVVACAYVRKIGSNDRPSLPSRAPPASISFAA
jgi:hypothetical protein